jgi:hypothetical protein
MTALKTKKRPPDLSQKPPREELVMLGIYVEKRFRDRIRQAGVDTKSNIRTYIIRAIKNQLLMDYGQLDE